MFEDRMLCMDLSKRRTRQPSHNTRSQPRPPHRQARNQALHTDSRHLHWVTCDANIDRVAVWPTTCSTIPRSSRTTCYGSLNQYKHALASGHAIASTFSPKVWGNIRATARKQRRKYCLRCEGYGRFVFPLVSVFVLRVCTGEKVADRPGRSTLNSGRALD